MQYKLGRLPIRKDYRTIRFVRLLNATLPPPPTVYDVDSQFANLVDNRMFVNDTLGDCVMACRGHYTLRFEDFEQKTVIPITDDEIKNEYFKESGGADSGLVEINSLNAWRKGWTAAGKNYDIYAFAAIDVTNHTEVEQCVYLFNGCFSGFSVPRSAMTQHGNGQIWDVVPNDGGIEGGHAVYIVAYNEIGPICITWGTRQAMTWAFWDKYFDEAYGVIDNIDSWMDPATDPVNIALLTQDLTDIGQAPSHNIQIATLYLPIAYINQLYSVKFLANNGIPPYSWSIHAGVLPAGMVLDADGTLHGIPTKSGQTLITFLASDTVGNASGVELTLIVKKSKCWLSNLF
jgi:hypothetical protein